MRNMEPPAKSKMAAKGPQNGRQGLQRSPTLGIGHSEQLSLNRFFDPSTPSMKKGCNGEKKWNGGANNGENSRPLTTMLDDPSCQIYKV